MDYSLAKGFKKGIIGALTSIVVLVSLTGFADISIWDLVEQHVRPVVGSISVGAALVMLLNYLKVRWGIGI